MDWSNLITQYRQQLPKDIKVTDAIAQRIYHLVDLTSLKATDTESSIAMLCEKGATSLGRVAGVCVYPQFIRMVATQFSGTTTKAVTVANFPEGERSVDDVLIEIENALEAGAQELDIVFPYKRFIQGDTEFAETFVSTCKAACGDNIILKIILETQRYPSFDTLAEAARCAITGGADFLKTGTGKIEKDTTFDDAIVLLTVIREKSKHTKIGFKAAGGVREVEQAATFLVLAENIMGVNYLAQQTFRIGASQLVDKLIKLA